MKNKLIILFVFLCMIFSVNGALSVHTQIDQPGEWAIEPIAKQIHQQNRVANTQELNQIIYERKNQLEQERLQFKKAKQKTLKKQNIVKEAVHALKSSETLVGGIGPQVSAIAKEFENSLRTTIPLEEKIIDRGFFTRILFGGNNKIAEQLESQVNQNKQRTQQLKNLFQNSECNTLTINILMEQIQNIEQEQIRLEQLAKKEKSKGLFRWFKSN